MESSRRDFLKHVGVIGVAAAVSGIADASIAAEAGKEVLDPTVKKRTGPYGKGLPITIAGYDYNRVRALVEGKETIEGCAHRFEVTGIGPLNNHAFFGPQTRDVTEIGLIPYILAYCNDDFRDYTLLPIPLLRVFRHKSIFVRTDRGIRTPADLRGKKVATVGYSSSGLTHVRGLLQEEYGVKPEEIEWISTQKDSAGNLTGGVSNWEKIRPKGVKITDAPKSEDESAIHWWKGCSKTTAPSSGISIREPGCFPLCMPWRSARKRRRKTPGYQRPFSRPTPRPSRSTTSICGTGVGRWIHSLGMDRNSMKRVN